MSCVYLRGCFDPARAIRNLGKRYEVDRLSFKPYPTCRLTHPAISAALALRAQLGRAAAEIEQIKLIIGPQAWDVVGRDAPERRIPATRIAAQFSVYWAVALEYGELTPHHLSEEMPPSEKVRNGVAKIDCGPDAAAARRDVGGCTLRARVPFGVRQIQQASTRGYPDHPLSDEELLDKFKSNLRCTNVQEDRALRLAEDIMSIDNLEDIVPFADAIAGVSG